MTKTGWKTTVWVFQATNWRDCTRGDRNIAKKEYLFQRTESFLLAAENNAIRTNYFKAKSDDVQRNSNCGLFRDRDEKVNYLNESSKQAQK